MPGSRDEYLRTGIIEPLAKGPKFPLLGRGARALRKLTGSATGLRQKIKKCRFLPAKATLTS